MTLRGRFVTRAIYCPTDLKLLIYRLAISRPQSRAWWMERCVQKMWRSMASTLTKKSKRKRFDNSHYSFIISTNFQSLGWSCREAPASTRERGVTVDSAKATRERALVERCRSHTPKTRRNKWRKCKLFAEIRIVCFKLFFSNCFFGLCALLRLKSAGFIIRLPA